MIYKTLNENEFINEFGNSGQYANNFSREGLKALYIISVALHETQNCVVI